MDSEVLHPSSDVLASTSDVLGSTARGGEDTTLMAPLSSGQIPVFLKSEMIVSGRIALYQACENRELNWSFVTTDPGFSAKYA